MGSFLSRLLRALGLGPRAPAAAPATTVSTDSPSQSSSDSSPGHSRVQAFHSTPTWQLHFNTVKQTSKLMLIDFTASWCGPCKRMQPVVDAMASKFTDVEFVKIDVDELSDVAQEFGVQAMPTFVLVKKGKEVDRLLGASKDELERKIQKHRALVPTS
ncbi:hypothetical protein ACJRO7_035423 [Eucalyptus globulus]|uniref:Thioredoxin domain-containing protein n=1 Tax=Eucalyptus globulus TaxID=34317 RepID=A0ABD3J7A7_EUCGL